MPKNPVLVIKLRYHITVIMQVLYCTHALSTHLLERPCKCTSILIVKVYFNLINTAKNVLPLFQNYVTLTQYTSLGVHTTQI